MLEEMFTAAKEDQAYQMVVEEVRKGLTKEALKLLPSDHPARSMTQQWDEIGIMDRRNDGLLIFQGTRIIVPRAARKKIKEYLHLPHLGQQLTYQAAALRYWWPGGFKEEICKLVEACQTCAVYSPSRQREEEAEEMYQPREPLDLVATDLFEIKGCHYLIVLDVFSGFPWVKKMGKSPKTSKVTEALNEIFLSYGYPKHIKSDGGGQYRSEFAKYCAEMYITHHRTSPFNSRSNGEAEKCVHKIKILIKKTQHAKGDFNVALARLRDSPMSMSKMSPSRLMFRRVLRFPGLPILPDEVDEVVAGVEKQAKKVSAKANRNSKVSRFGKDVVELEEGLHVLLQNNKTKLFDVEAQIKRVCEGGRSAYVQGKDRGGKMITYLRNRRFMVLNPKYKLVEEEDVPESSMVTGEAEIAEDSCIPARLLSRKAHAAFSRTKSSVSGILKGSLALLSRAPSERPTARWPGKLRRRTVTWGPPVSQ